MSSKSTLSWKDFKKTLQSCSCSKSQHYVSIFLWIFICFIIGLTIYLLIRNFQSAKTYQKKKQVLQSTIKNDIENILKTNIPLHTMIQNLNEYEIQAINHQIESTIKKKLETQNMIPGIKNSFYSLYSTNSEVLTHGKIIQNDHISNDTVQHHLKSKIPIQHIVLTALGGGGFIKYQWNGKKLMVSYVELIPGTKFILAGNFEQ